MPMRRWLASLRVRITLLATVAVAVRDQGPGVPEEALVRIVTPVRGNPDSAHALATQVARRVMPELDRALP